MWKNHFNQKILNKIGVVNVSFVSIHPRRLPADRLNPTAQNSSRRSTRSTSSTMTRHLRPPQLAGFALLAQLVLTLLTPSTLAFVPSRNRDAPHRSFTVDTVDRKSLSSSTSSFQQRHERGAYYSIRRHLLPELIINADVISSTTTGADAANLSSVLSTSPLLSFSDQGQNLAGIFFQASLLPYLTFLYFLSFRGNRTPTLGNFGFQYLLLFVLGTIPSGIITKSVYGLSLANVDWLHGGAEALLTMTNVLIVSQLKMSCFISSVRFFSAQSKESC